MSLSAYIEGNKCLVFPTMCDAYIQLEYSKNNIETKSGIFAIDGSFTGQFVLKPYDVNGYGDNTVEADVDKSANGGVGNIYSKKTMPSSSENIAPNSLVNNQDQKYLPNSERYSHSMCLFHNTNMSVNLVNTTTFNQNNPAEYKIQFKLTVNGEETVLETPAVFTSRKHHYFDTSRVRTQNKPSGGVATIWDDYHLQFLYKGSKVIGKEVGQPQYYHNANEYVEGYTIKYTPSSLPTTEYNEPSNSVVVVINAPSGDQPLPRNCIPVGAELFNDKGQSLGTVNQIIPAGGIFTHHSIIMNPLPADAEIPTFTNNSKLYIHVEREPMYIHTTAHIAISYAQATRRMSIFYNGIEIATTTHSATAGSFTLDESDIYIGQNASLSYPDNRKTQFMGELESIIFTNTYMNNFTSLFNPLAPYQNIVLYYDFSEGRDNNG